MTMLTMFVRYGTDRLSNKVYKSIDIFVAIKLLNRNGITSVCDARVYWQRGHDTVWKEVRNNSPGEFTIRAVMDLWAAPEMNDNYQISQIKSRFSENDDLLKFSGVKVFVPIQYNP